MIAANGKDTKMRKWEKCLGSLVWTKWFKILSAQKKKTVSGGIGPHKSNIIEFSHRNNQMKQQKNDAMSVRRNSIST